MRERDLIETFDDAEAEPPDEADELNLSGEVLGQFKLIRKLAEGGMSQVYLADQKNMERWAAVKVLRIASTKLRARFRTEARAVSRLNHPNIVTVYSSGELPDGSMYLAMEFLDGRNLARVMERETITPVRALNIAQQIGNALAYAHHQGVVHRDLKPQNIMSTRSVGHELIKVLDFGLATVAEQSRDTPAGAIVGTPRYMSPEQCSGAVTTHLSDQYSLGLILYELLTGRPALIAETLVGYINAHVNETPPAMCEVCSTPGLDIIDPIVERMLAKSPGDRFATTDTALTALAGLSAQLDPSRQTRPHKMRLRTPHPSTLSKPSMGSAWRVFWVGAGAPVAPDSLRQLGMSGFYVDNQASDKVTANAADVWLLVTGSSGIKERARQWRSAGDDTARAIMCVDAAPDDIKAVAALHLVDNVIIGQHPLPGDVLEAALKGLKFQNGNLIEALCPDAVGTTVTDPAEKSNCIDEVLSDLGDQNIRGSTLRSVKAALEEMLLNALMHAPAAGASTKGSGERMGQRAHNEVLVRWAVGDHAISLSVRDPYGSFEPKSLVSSKVRAQNRDRVPRGADAGLGLEIIGRSAAHVIVAVSPGTFTEVIARVPISPKSDPHERSLTVLAFRPKEMQIGDRLTLHETTAKEGSRIALHGEINETSDLGEIYGRAGRVELDLGKVTAVNSRGVAAWFRAIENRNPALQLFLANCSPPVVAQLNMMSRLAPRDALLSVLVPYICEICSHEQHECFDLTDPHVTVPPEPPECPTCREPMELDDIPEQYFAFLEDA